MSDFYIDKQIQAIRLLHRDILSREFSGLSIFELLNTQSHTLLQAHKDGKAECLFHLACWSPDHIGSPAEEILGNPITIEQARTSMAREYGYSNWSDVEMKGNVLLDSDFESAVEHVVHGQLAELKVLLSSRPELARQQSQFGHKATLLHYIGANGVETQRQVTPYNAVEIAQCLIDAGADVNAIANMYGGATVIGLVESSAHPANAGVTESLVSMLRECGAS